MGRFSHALCRTVVTMMLGAGCVFTHAVPASFTFEGQLASGSEGVFEDGADFALIFIMENDGADLAVQSFDVSDFVSVTLVSGAVAWNWSAVNAAVPLFSGFQTNDLGQLLMGNGVFLRAGQYDLATFTGGSFGAASLDGNDRATSADSVPVSSVGVFVGVSEPALPSLLAVGLLASLARRGRGS